MTTARLLPFLCAVTAMAQVCELSVSGVNRNRRLIGGVNAECPAPNPFHTAPFGNWGVTSNFGSKENGHQFQGWCHNTRVCDNNGSCHDNCADGWYEWNSCTDDPAFRAPNCTLYNANECREQVTVTGVNVHGTRVANLAASCPADTNGDGLADSGGCSRMSFYSSGTNFMSVYELDPASPDELVQTIYFPETALDLSCGVFGCARAASGWMRPSAYDSPVSPARISAEMATVVNHVTFRDPSRVCGPAAASASAVSGASYRGPVLAAGSIASAFGLGFSSEIAAAAALPLPVSLAGISISVKDAAGASRAAPLFYVSPSQINWLLPEGTARGLAVVTISRGDTIRWNAGALIDSVVPGLFSADATGSGVAAAVALRVAADGTQTSQLVFDCASGSCRALPVDLGAASDQTYLLLFGTGIRGRTSLAAVSVRIGGVACALTYAGPQGQFIGLDQVNVALPRTLAGRGDLDTLLAVDGRAANPVRVTLK